MTCETESGPEGTQERQEIGPPIPPIPPLDNDMVAMIAHELRSPLAVMSNVLSVCRASAGSATMPVATEVLNRQVKKALRLVNELMDLARITGEPLERSPVELRRVVLKVAQELVQELRDRRQTLVLEPSCEPVWLQGDAQRLEQIAAHVLENSCKYTPDGGRIEMALTREEGQAVLRIRDDGAGIASDELPRIFEPYFRGRHAGRHSRNGLGLGLTITHRLVQLHGGSIEARSDGEGRGSEFTIRLPASVGADVALTPAPGAG